KRADRKIAQPQVGEAALLPDPKQRIVEREPDRVIAALDRDADPFPEIAAVDIGATAKPTAVVGVGAVEPERERDRVAEHEIDVAAAQGEPSNVGTRIGPHLHLPEQPPPPGLPPAS